MKRAELTYVKPSALALLGRLTLYAFAFALAILTPPPTELPVRSRVMRALAEADEVISGFTDCVAKPPALLTGRLSGASCLLQKTGALNPKPMATILRGAGIRILECSRHGFRKALVDIELSDGSIRRFRVRNTELEVVSKCLELVPGSWPTASVPE